MSDTSDVTAVRVIYQSPLMWLVPRRFVALTWRRTIHVRGANLSPWLMRHERKHVEQFQRYGTLGFLVRYLWQCARYGYRNAPLEREARLAESASVDAYPAQQGGAGYDAREKFCPPLQVTGDKP